MLLGHAPQQPPSMVRTWPQGAARAPKRLPMVVKPAKMASQCSPAAGKARRAGKIQPHKSQAVGKRRGRGALEPVTQPRLLRDWLRSPLGGFSPVFHGGKPSPVFLPGEQPGGSTLSPIFEPPHEHHARLSEPLEGCGCNSPTRGCPVPPMHPRHNPVGPLLAHPAPTGGADNSVGWDQRSRAQRSRHYTLTSCLMEQRFLLAKINSPQSKLGAWPARSLPTSPPLPRGRPGGSPPTLTSIPPCGVCLWVCKMDRGQL